jgi:Trp operon repressor
MAVTSLGLGLESNVLWLLRKVENEAVVQRERVIDQLIEGLRRQRQKERE